MASLPGAGHSAESHQQPHEAVTISDPTLYSSPLNDMGLNYTSLLTCTWIFLDKYCTVL